jgi:hypothetical protein
LAHLRRWARPGIAKSHFVEWNGKPVASIKTGFASGVRLAQLDVTTGNVTPHTLRHTAATWLMQRRAPMWEAAGFLGMSEKTLRDTYGHHHPDYMLGAVEAMGFRPTLPKKHVALVVSLVEEKAKRVEAAQAPEIIGGARQAPYEAAFLEGFLGLIKMLIQRVPTKIPTKLLREESRSAAPAGSRQRRAGRPSRPIELRR